MKKMIYNFIACVFVLFDLEETQLLGVRWQSHSYQDEETDALMRNFQNLKDILTKIDDLRLIEPDVFLSPFLDVIRSEDTSGPVTSLALAAINKFLSYGLIGLLSSVGERRMFTL